MEHKCKRFKTVMKRKGVRHIVECRECGKRRIATPLHNIAGPKGSLRNEE